jgi:hypothetical protein
VLIVAGDEIAVPGRGDRTYGQLGVAPAASASAPSLANTVAKLSEQLRRRQRQIERLRERVKEG